MIEGPNQLMSAASKFARHRLWVGALGALLCPSCFGGQTGGEVNEPVPAAGLQCEDVVHELGFDEPTSLGASPAELLAPVLGESNSPLLWSDSTAPVAIGPERGESSVVLTIEYRGGRIAWRDSEPKNAGGPPADGATPAAFPVCLDRLEVDVVAQLATAGGALDETFPVTLHMSSAMRVSLFQSLEVAALSGSLSVSAPAGSSAPQLLVYADWDEVGFHGTLDGQVQLTRKDETNTSSGSVGTMSITYAVWPPPGDPRP